MKWERCKVESQTEGNYICDAGRLLTRFWFTVWNDDFLVLTKARYPPEDSVAYPAFRLFLHIRMW